MSPLALLILALAVAVVWLTWQRLLKGFLTWVARKAGLYIKIGRFTGSSAHGITLKLPKSPLHGVTVDNISIRWVTEPPNTSIWANMLAGGPCIRIEVSKVCLTVNPDDDVPEGESSLSNEDGMTSIESSPSWLKKIARLELILKQVVPLLSLEIRDVSIINENEDATPLLHLEAVTAIPSGPKQEVILKGLEIMSQKADAVPEEECCLLRLDHASFQHVGNLFALQHPSLELGLLTLTQTPSSFQRAHALSKIVTTKGWNKKRKSYSINKTRNNNLVQFLYTKKLFHTLTVRCSALRVHALSTDTGIGDVVSAKFLLDSMQIKCSVNDQVEDSGVSFNAAWGSASVLCHYSHQESSTITGSLHPCVDLRLDDVSASVSAALTSDKIELECDARLSSVGVRVNYEEVVAVLEKTLLLFMKKERNVVDIEPQRLQEQISKQRNKLNFKLIRCALEQQSSVGLFNNAMDVVLQAKVEPCTFNRFVDQDCLKILGFESHGIVLQYGTGNDGELHMESTMSTLVSLNSLRINRRIGSLQNGNNSNSLLLPTTKSLDVAASMLIIDVKQESVRALAEVIDAVMSNLASLRNQISTVTKQRVSVRSHTSSTSISLDKLKFSVSNRSAGETSGTLCLEACSSKLSTAPSQTPGQTTDLLLQVSSSDIHFTPVTGAGAEHPEMERVKLIGLTNFSLGLEGCRRRIELQQFYCFWDADALLCGLEAYHNSWKEWTHSGRDTGVMWLQKAKSKEPTLPKNALIESETCFLVKVGSTRASMPLTGDMEVGLTLSGGEASLHWRSGLLASTLLNAGPTILSLKDKPFIEWKTMSIRSSNDALPAVFAQATALTVSVPFDRQPGPTLRYLSTYIKGFAAFAATKIRKHESKKKGTTTNTPPSPLPRINLVLDGGVTFRFEHHPLEAWLAKYGPTLQSIALQSHLSADELQSGFNPLDKLRNGLKTVPCSDLLLVRVDRVDCSILLIEHRGDEDKESIIEFISEVDPPTKGVALDAVRKLVLDDTVIQGAEVWVAGAIEPFVAVKRLNIRGPIALARQKVAPPMTFKQSIPLSVRKLSRTIDVETSLPACRPPLKLYTSVSISVQGGLTVCFNPGFTAVFAIMGLAGKRLVSSGLGNLVDNNGDPIRRPAPVPWWDDIRYVWRGGATLEIEGFKFVLAAERTLSFCPENLTPRLVVEACRVEGRVGRFISNDLPIQVSSEHDYSFAFRSLVCDMYSRSLDVNFGSSSVGTVKSSLFVKVPLLDVPLVRVAATVGWVGPGGKDGSAHHIFPSPPVPSPTSPTPPPAQAPVFVAEAFKAEAFDVNLDISFVPFPSKEMKSNSASVNTARGYFGEAQVAFFRRLNMILKAQPPAFRAIAKKGTFFSRKPKGGPPKRPLPRLLRNLCLSVSSGACNVERWHVRHHGGHHQVDALEGRLVLSSSSFSFRASWLCNQPGTVVRDLLVQVEDVKLSYTDRKSLVPLGVVPPRADAVLSDHEFLIISAGWVTIVRVGGEGHSKKASPASLRISIGSSRLVLGDGENHHSEDLAEAVGSIVQIVGSFSKNQLSAVYGKSSTRSPGFSDNQKRDSSLHLSFEENGAREEREEDLLSLLLRQREDQSLIQDGSRGMEEDRRTNEETKGEDEKEIKVNIKYEIDVVDVQAMGAWEGGLASVEGQARLVLVADVGRVVGYADGSTLATTSVQAYLGLGESVQINANRTAGPWLHVDMHKGYVAADGGSEVRRVLRCVNVEVRHEKKKEELKVKVGEVGASLKGQEFRALIAASSGLANVGRMVAQGAKSSIQRSFSRFSGRIEILELINLAQERCCRWKDVLMLDVSAGEDGHVQSLITEAIESEVKATEAYEKMKACLQKEELKTKVGPRNAKLSTLMIDVDAVKWNLLASGASDGTSIVRVSSWGLHFERQVIKSSKGSGSARLIIHGLEISDATGRLPEGTSILAHWNPDGSYESDPMLRVVASMGGSSGSGVVVFQHLNATLRPMALQLTESVASSCRDYFVQHKNGKEVALRQEFLRSVGKATRAGGTAGRQASQSQIQNHKQYQDRKGELRCRFAYFKLDRAHLRITYLGRPVSIRDRILVINSYACEDMEGRWSDLLATVRNKAILSAVWSGLGLQGGKVRELLEGAGIGGGEGGVGMQVEKQMQDEVEVGAGVGVGVEGNALGESREQRKGGNGTQAETDTEVEMDDSHDPNDLAKRKILLGGRMLTVKQSTPSAASNSEPKGWMRTLAHAAKELGLKNPSRRR